MFTMLEVVGSEEKYVPSLAGLVSDCTAYHHRQTSLESTIVSMAQDFCGTNNLNLLKPGGLFGSRDKVRLFHY
jgi:DNA topoisomerase-2